MKLKVTLAFFLVLTVACSDAEGPTPEPTGIVELTIYGEDYAESGIPADEVDDGWRIAFTRFSLELGDVYLGGHAVFEGSQSFDLTEASGGGGQVVTSVELPAGTHAPSFYIRSLHVVGSALRGDDTIIFDWRFEDEVHYHPCDDQVEVAANAETAFEITIHPDHLFFSSLVADEPPLLFDPFAQADTDGDMILTRAELEAASIGGFDPGNESIDNLWEWLNAQYMLIGHINGEGHCDSHTHAHDHHHDDHDHDHDHLHDH